MGRRALHVSQVKRFFFQLLTSNRADYADDGCIQEMLRWCHPHTAINISNFQFTEDEELAMLRLPRKECLCIPLFCFTAAHDYLDLATPAQIHDLYLTLVTLLFSYTYDARTTEHDPTPESAWTIGILTPVFSALDSPPYNTPSESSVSAIADLVSTLVVSYRRSLAFPLHRSFALSEACRIDVADILLGGKRLV